ncbi:TadE/TadG family type IV pilus assembly protein [Nocardioides sp. TF02-7]|uniref:TadE/TadG family type IV pilus assembly protein n=1 Tax=Nocardioides sp. TF02-7 TaxID=2917724 RepID=UPI001F05AAB3|nr:TadE/TadG family type IV pilus assembly protein [Nocardioides sp. TF02-7]UMG93025.1 pilus assembly protein [Nocardioides sp. TF02-7]
MARRTLLSAVTGRTGRRRGSDDGAAAVEFALILPILMFLVFGIISFGYMLSFRQAMSQAAAEGARAAAVAPSGTPAGTRQADAAAAVDDALGSYGVSCSGGSLTHAGGPSGTCSIEIKSSCTSGPAGSSVRRGDAGLPLPRQQPAAGPGSQHVHARAAGVRHRGTDLVTGRIRSSVRRRLAVHRDERGAVGVFVGVFLSLVMVGVGAISIDLGMQRVARRDMQALADVLALDLAREINGRTQAQLAAEGDPGNPGSAVSQSVARNDHAVGEGLDVEVDWGSYTGGVWNTATEPPSAVKVTASTDVEYSFADGDGSATRTAYATAASTACFRLGSFVAAIDSGDGTVLGPLNDLLGVNLSLVSYKALAAADVTLGELAANPRIGSPDALLTGAVTFRDLLLATIDVLRNEATGNQAAITALNSLVNVAASVGSIRLGDVLHIAPGDSAALDVALRVLDLVASARVATGEHFIDIPNLHAGVAGLGNHISGSLSVVSAAQMACGTPNSTGATAKNAQVSGTLGLDFFNLPSLNLGIGTLQTAKGDGSLVIEIGTGTGQLVSPPPVYCGSGTAADPHRFAVRVLTELASYRLDMNLTVEGDLKVSSLLGLGLGDLLDSILGGILGNKKEIEIKLALRVGTTADPGGSIANLSLPPNDKTPVETGSSIYLDPSRILPDILSVKIGGKTITDLPLVRPLTDLVVDALTGVGNHFVRKTVAPLLDNLDEMLIGPVARMLGLRFAGADVYAVGAVCGRPNLAG